MWNQKCGFNFWSWFVWRWTSWGDGAEPFQTNLSVYSLNVSKLKWRFTSSGPVVQFTAVTKQSSPNNRGPRLAEEWTAAASSYGKTRSEPGFQPSKLRKTSAWKLSKKTRKYSLGLNCSISVSKPEYLSVSSAVIVLTSVTGSVWWSGSVAYKDPPSPHEILGINFIWSFTRVKECKTIHIK